MALVVDAANVVGSRPDGWWRDRAGAAGRLVAALDAALRAGTLDGPVVVVLEGAARPGAAEGRIGADLTVVHAERDGDTRIVAEAAASRRIDRDGTTTVITADHGLRDRVLAEGASVLGPSWLIDRI